MNEPKDRQDRGSGRHSAEGVRIIPAEEAQAALEAGQAAGRRPDDELRFGDVPPAPSGPRPTHRFPLPATVDPAAAVPLPPLAGGPRPDERPAASIRPAARPVDPQEAHDSTAWDDRGRSGRAQPAAGSDVHPGADTPSGASPDVDSPDVGSPGADLPRPDLLDVAVEDASDVPTGQVPLTSEGFGSSRPELDAQRSHWYREGPPNEERPPGPGLAARRAEMAWGASPAAEPPIVGRREAPGAATEAPAIPDYSSGQAPQWGQPAAPPPDPGHGAIGPIRAPAAHMGNYDEYDQIHTANPEGAGAGRVPADRAPSPANPPSVDSAPLEEGITMSGGSGADLPHWTDPPTGEVPRILAGQPEADEDLAAWQALGSRGMRWRDGADDWDQLDELQDLGSEETRVGTLDQSRTEHSDLYSFDDAFDRLEEERSGSHQAIAADDPPGSVAAEPERISTRVSTGGRNPGRRAPARPARRRPGGGDDGAGDSGRDLGTAALVGTGLVVLLLIAYAIGSLALLVLAAAAILACAVEAYGMLQRSGFRPATLLGLVATVGVVFAAYYRGIGALALVTALMFVATMLWYLFGIVEARPLANVAVTTMTFVWVGVLGSFGAVMLRLPHGKGLFLGAILPTVAADIVAYFAGSRIGTRPLAPSVSPGKTVEGVLAGAAAALVMGAIVGREITPWGGIKHGLLLGLVVAVVAPVGDLFESMIKRDLSVKDSGTALPGHGGLFDRFDSVILVLPAAFYLAYLFNVAA